MMSTARGRGLHAWRPAFLILLLMCAWAPAAAAPPGVAEAQVVAPDAAAWNTFGHAVATDGTHVVIGSPGEATDAGSNSGSVHVFRVMPDGLVHEAKLTAPDASGQQDRFGWSVGIHNGRIAVGAPYFDDSGRGGAVYVFAWDSFGEDWGLEQRLTAASGEPRDRFGRAVALHGDTLIVGVQCDDEQATNAGAAHVYQRGADGWSLQQVLYASDPDAYAEFGWSVALDDGRAVVGAHRADATGHESGAAYVFKPAGPDRAWTQVAMLAGAGTGDRFGESVAVYGGRALVGAHLNDAAGDDAGAAYLYQENEAGEWTLEQQFLPASGRDQWSGHAVALGDGLLVVGAPHADAGAPDTGQATVYVHDGSTWRQRAVLQAPVPGEGHAFGHSVAISGTLVAVGAAFDDHAGDESGSAYRFLPAEDDDGVPGWLDVCPDTPDPLQEDLDGDFIGDACDPDVDGDGLDDVDERARGTDAREPDTDQDGLLDGDEVYRFRSDPLDQDTDDDTLLDGAEVYVHRSDPRDRDTDGDLFSDPTEVAAGSDPRNPLSVPVPGGAATVHSWGRGKEVPWLDELEPVA